MAAAQLLVLVSSIAVSFLLIAQQSISDRSFPPELKKYLYVTPSRSNLPCNGSKPCHTLEEYANNPGIYFVSDTIFYFYPGKHHLNASLKLCDIHHLHFLAVNYGIITVNITFDELVNITWINCTDVSLSSINFYVTENFTHLFLFESTSAIGLLNITIISNVNRVGCSAVLIKDSEAKFVNSSFIGILGIYGSALAVYRSNVTFSGNSMFGYNQGFIGGAILSLNSALMFAGRNTFVNNTVHYVDTDPLICSYSNTGAMSQYSGSGGAIASVCSLPNTKPGSNCSFLKISGNSTFAKNQACVTGGAIMTDSSSLIFKGLVNFINNSVDHIYGGALAIFGSLEVMFVVERVSFSNNRALYGGALLVRGAAVFFDGIDESQNSTEFIGNSAGFGGAIKCFSCALFFKSNAIFTENTAGHGGAVSLSNDDSSRPVLTVYTNYTLYFIWNHADTTGGALQVKHPTACYFSSKCFISFATASSDYSIENASLIFINNSAGKEGTVLYGGELSKCLLYCSGNDTDCKLNTHGKQVHSAMEVFMNKSHIISEGNVSDISSTTVRICICDKHHVQNCNVNDIRVPGKLFPGQLFNVTIVGLGQGNHSVPSIIMTQIANEESYNLNLIPATQRIDSTCTTLYYRAYLSESNKDAQSFKLYHDNPCQSLVDGVTVGLYFKSCPSGFVHRGQKCDCDEWLLKLTQNCYIDNLSVERNKNNFWISLDSNRTGLLLTRFGCPLDFCKLPPTNVTLDDQNSRSLCDFNRSGVLCGSCMDSLSLVLGSLHCITCSNFYILLVIPFALVGVALVAIILLLRLTVDVGTINGLLFFANIIQANRQAFFPRSINFFTVFISWLNLDLGIETCFCDGLTFYEYSWLQFLFPFYIWFLISVIIVVSHYSLTVAKYLGNFNPVAVLATLLLMSYGKILQAIITPLSWGHLTHMYTDTVEHSDCHAIWLYDGNIGFFTDPGHIVLAVFAILVLLCLFLPYTLILLFGHYLQAYSHRIRVFSWINKIKPFIDVYHAPYRSNGRHWTGLLLVTRGGLFITFAVNAVGSDNFNILATSSVVIALLSIKGRVYENHYKEALESSFLLNLGILSVATFYVRENDLGNVSQALLSGLSVGVAFVTFLGILLFHVFHQIKRMKMWSIKSNERTFVENGNDRPGGQQKRELEFTCSAAQLRESLLESKLSSVNNYGTY